MAFTTYYESKGAKSAYTTKSLTEHHLYLNKAFNGSTYEHPSNTITHFCIGVPLDSPLALEGEEVKELSLPMIKNRLRK